MAISETARSFTLDDSLVRSVALQDGKRKDIRVPYPAHVRVAPFDGQNLPSFYTFRVVQGNDISSRGISFFAPSHPEAESLVFMLGEYPEVIYIIGEVRHSRQGFFHRKLQCIVGCEFVRKLSE